jgi:hypothetical protein
MTREEIINDIKKIVNKYNGSISAFDMELESSFSVFGIGKTQLIAETFEVDSVGVLVFVNDSEVDLDDVEYAEFSSDILSEILVLLENYDVDQEKTWKRCQD